MKCPKATKGLLSSFYGTIKDAARQKPVLSMVLVILSCTLALPFVSALALFPLVGLLSFAQYLESKGIGTVVYIACVEGFVLSIIILMLFILAYTVAVCSSIFLVKFHTPNNLKFTINK